MRVLATLFAASIALAFASAVPAAADPISCVTPDGAPFPPPPGCVQDNGMPCSASLPDLNAACMWNPVVYMWLNRF